MAAYDYGFDPYTALADYYSSLNQQEPEQPVETSPLQTVVPVEQQQTVAPVEQQAFEPVEQQTVDQAQVSAPPATLAQEEPVQQTVSPPPAETQQTTTTSSPLISMSGMPGMTDEINNSLLNYQKARWADLHPENPIPDPNDPQWQQAMGMLQWSYYQNPDAYKGIVSSGVAPDVRTQVSDLLKQNKFSEALNLAKENKAWDLIQDPITFSSLRGKFTPEEAAAFANSVPADWFSSNPANAGKIGSDQYYNPSETIDRFSNPGEWYPSIGLSTKSDALSNIIQGGVTGALGIMGGMALAPAFGAGAAAGAGSAAGAGTGAAAGSGALAAVESAAIKSAIGSAISTAISGGDLGDIAKSALIGAGTGGLSSAAAPELFNGLKDAGLSSNVAKALTNSIVSGGVSAIRGGDPLQSAVTSGLGSYIGSTIGDYARENDWSPEDVKLAGRIGSVGGSGLASAIVGGDPTNAMIQSAINQFSSPAMDAASEQAKRLFPELYDKVTGLFNGDITDWEAFANSADAQSATDALANQLSGGLDYVNVDSNRVMLDQNGNIVSATGTPAYYDQNGLLQFGTPAPGEGSSYGDGLDEVTVTSNRIPVDYGSGLDEVNVTSNRIPVDYGSGLDEVTVTSNRIPVDYGDNVVTTGTDTGTSVATGVPDYGNTGEEVEVSTNRNPADNTITDFGNTGEEVTVATNRSPADNTVTDWGDTGEEVTVSGNNDDLDEVVVTGNKDDLDEVVVTGTRGTPGSTVKDPNIKITTGALPKVAAAAAAGLIPKDEFLDSAAEFLKSTKGSEGAKLAALKQIYEGLDPSLASLLSERLSRDKGSSSDSSNLSPLTWMASNQAAPGAAYTGFGGFANGGVARFTDGGSADENASTQGPTSISSIFKDLSNIDRENGMFVCAEPEYLHSSPSRDKNEILKKLVQMQAFGAGGGANMARGGLAQAYKEAAPEGHNPEFITGLTGYYAQGGGTGQSDDIPSMLHDGDYVVDADVVAALGDGSSKAGAEVLEKMRNQIPYREGHPGKPVPAKIADGEYVFPAAFVTALGGGDNKQGSKILDGMREKIRAHKRSAPTSKIPPKAKSPLDYLKGVKG